MSRKANNLRRRLGIEQESLARCLRLRAIAERQVKELTAHYHAFETLKRKLTYPQSIMVRVEENWDRVQGSFDRYMCNVTFSPDAYVYMRVRGPGPAAVENISLLAQMIGEEIGQKVTRTLFERLTAADGGRVRA
jgi:hypothetical protein